MLSCLQVGATDSLYTKVVQPHTFFTTDVYNNIYTITPNHEIIRQQLTGLNKVTYSNVRYGTPTMVDAGNPLKTLVFYADQQVLVILDKMLAEIAALRLSNLNGRVYRPSILCRASGGDHFWMFDDLSQRIVRLDENGNQIAISEPWYQLFTEQQTPLWMQSHADQLYVYTTSGQLCVFDAFATLGMQLDLPAQPLDMLGSSVLLHDAQGLRLLDIFTGQNTILPIVNIETQMEVQPQYMYSGNGSEIQVYLLR